MARIESPPNSKKLSLILIVLSPKTLCQISERMRSVSVHGLKLMAASSSNSSAGCGRARRSFLPLAVRGKASNKTKKAGTIY